LPTRYLVADIGEHAPKIGDIVLPD